MATTINASSSAGLVQTADTSTILQLQTNGTAALTIDASQNVGIGTATPRNVADFVSLGLNDTTGGLIDFFASGTRSATISGGSGNLTLGTVIATPMVFNVNTNEAMRITSAGNVGIGTSNPETKLHVEGTVDTASSTLRITATGACSAGFACNSTGTTIGTDTGGILFKTGVTANTPNTTGTERARIDSSGNLLVGTTTNSPAGNNVVGAELQALGSLQLSRDGGAGLQVNRKTDDGELVAFRQAGTQEGSISVSGTTVSYNGGHLSRWAQTTAPKDNTLVKGTVLSNLDEMNVYTDADGNPIDNEQLNKVKVSDVEGDANVAGVFVNWTHDDAHDVDEINMAMTGDMIIRIAQGVTVARGDLLMSAGDGTAKPQGDDIVRSKTVAKVTSIHVTCTYADGSFCVPCVLMAC